MVSRSKNKAKTEKAPNPYTQSTSKVKKKDVTDKSSSDNKQSEKPDQKSEASGKAESKKEITASSTKGNTDVDNKSKERIEYKEQPVTTENKDGNSPEGKVKSENKDTEKKQNLRKPSQGTSQHSKSESDRSKMSKQDSKKDETTSRKSKASSNQDTQKDGNTTQQVPKQEKAVSTIGSESQHTKKKTDTESDKAIKTAESEKKAEEKENSDSSEESDSEEEESDEEEDPLIAQLASKYNLKVEEPEIQEEEEEEERLLSAKNNLVDLNTLSLRYNAKNKSALQPILVDYGLPDPYAGQEYKPEKKARKKKKKAQTVEDERDLEKEQQRSGHRGRTFEDIRRTREYLQDDYLEKLQDRVAKQRKDIKKKSEELEQKLLNMEQRKKDALTFEKKLQRHELTHDGTHLTAIPKSNVYKMIGLENKLRSQNKLRTRQDMEDLWSCAEDPGALRDFMKRQGMGASSPIKSSPERSYLDESFASSRTSSMSSLTQEKEHTMEFQRTLTQIEEIKEPSRPSTRDANAMNPWAVTQLSPHKHGRRSQSPAKGSRSLSPMKTNISLCSSPSRKPQDPHAIAKQAAAELDKKHPMKELPPLNCFSVDMNDHGPDPEELLKGLQGNRREKERKLFVKRIRSMYQRSKANVASTQRIMEKRYDDFTLDDEAPPTDTWLSSYDLKPVDDRPEPVHPAIQYMHDRPWLKHVRRRAIVTIVEESEPPSGVQSQKTSASIVNRQRPCSRDLPSRPSSIHSYQPSAVPALCMETVTANSKHLEAKCLSSLWTNYLGAGKSLFAH